MEDILAEFIFAILTLNCKNESAKIGKHGSIAKINSKKINKKTNYKKKCMNYFVCCESWLKSSLNEKLAIKYVNKIVRS